MDDFTQELVELAFQTCKGQKRRKKDLVNVEDLIRQMERHWVTYRDGTIAIWAARILDRVPRQRLEGLVERVNGLLIDCGVYWEFPYEDDPPEWAAEFSAQGLAALRWIYRENTGKAKVLRYTREELATWLRQAQNQQQVTQLPLFPAR